jgi:hypothetical protein
MTSAYDAAVIAQEPAMAIQATRSPCSRQRDPSTANPAATNGGMIIHRSLGDQMLRTCHP